MSGIFSISRFRMATDGPGISTLIGFSGCPLNCQYCPNPICHTDRSQCPDYSARELIDFVRRDELYMRMTGGGIVFGGGEPLGQEYFVKECALYSQKTLPDIPLFWWLPIGKNFNMLYIGLEPADAFLDIAICIISRDTGNPDPYRILPIGSMFLF